MSKLCDRRANDCVKSRKKERNVVALSNINIYTLARIAHINTHTRRDSNRMKSVCVIHLKISRYPYIHKHIHTDAVITSKRKKLFMPSKCTKKLKFHRENCRISSDEMNYKLETLDDRIHRVMNKWNSFFFSICSLFIIFFWQKEMKNL